MTHDAKLSELLEKWPVPKTGNSFDTDSYQYGYALGRNHLIDEIENLRTPSPTDGELPALLKRKPVVLGRDLDPDQRERNVGWNEAIDAMRQCRTPARDAEVVYQVRYGIASWTQVTKKHYDHIKSEGSHPVRRLIVHPEDATPEGASHG